MTGTDAYLQQFIGSAELDQAGLKFQVDWATQLRKLRSFQSGEPGVWMIKAIQAAVASGASKVGIKLTNEFFEVSFETRADLNANQNGWAEHLRLAVELAVSQQPPGLRLVHQGRVLFSSGVPHPIQAEGTTYLQLFHLPYGARAISHQLGIADIQLSLARRCCLCPVPVFLEGLPLNLGRPERSKIIGATRPDLTHYWLAETVGFAEPGQPALILACPAVRPAEVLFHGQTRLPPLPNRYQRPSLIQFLPDQPALESGHCQAAQRASFDPAAHWLLEMRESPPVGKGAFTFQALPGVAARVQEKATFWEKGCPTAACHSWLGLSARGDCPGGFYYVNDGILLNPVPIPGSYPGTTLVQAGSAIATDLSQFNPVQDDHLRGQLEGARAQSHSLLERCSPCWDNSLPRAVRSQWERFRPAT